MKIFVNTPYSRDANSFWRCMGPLSYLAKNSGGDVSIHLPPDGQSIAWDRISEFDLIFMHRPCRMDDLKLLQLAKLLNIPVWSDYDDWLYHLPDWNQHRASYHNPQVQNAMAAITACSDIVSVSTSALSHELSKINEHVVIIPNAYRSDLFSFREAPLPSRKEHFCWRGTNTHDGDLLSVASAFARLSKKIDFLGAPPYSVTSHLDPSKYQAHDFVDPMLYWRWIHQLAPKVWLFPLADIFFNRCKSNISWMEANHAGAICVAPDLPEWRQPGVVTYNPGDAEDFLNAAEMAMEMDETTFNSYVALGRAQIKEKYDIAIINQFRTGVLKSIFHPQFTRNQRDAFNPLTGVWALNEIKKVPGELETA